MANRRAWEERLPSALRLAARLGHPLAVALIDVDNFKAFNDRHGHPAGDAALREIGGRWAPHVRDVDVLARIGGEEFGLLLAGMDTTVALEVVERFARGHADRLTASAGIAAWARPLSAEAVVAEADQALYNAKRDGRDRACLSRVRGPGNGDGSVAEAFGPRAAPG